MINRAAILLKVKHPAIGWINEADPLGKDQITLENANEERTVYLVDDYVAEDPVNRMHWLKLNWKVLFETELEGWYVDDALWPKNLTFKMFQEWFELECHSVITDTVDAPLEDDGY